MLLHRWRFPILLVLAGFAFWLLLAGPSKLLGIDTGQAGTALLVIVAWVSLYAISRVPHGTLEKTISPGEWKAWLGSGFMAVAIAYFLSKLHVFAAAAVPHNPEASAVGTNLVLLLIAWSVLSGVMSSRWKGEVEQDERDREIERQAGSWGRIALTVLIIGIAVTIGLSPPERLQWATHLMIANLLVMALMCGCHVRIHGQRRVLLARPALMRT